MFKRGSVYWLVHTSSIAALNITCSYISEILADLLTRFVVLENHHVSLGGTIKNLSIVSKIAQIVLLLAVRPSHQVWYLGPPPGKRQRYLLILGLLLTLLILLLAGAAFLLNFAKLFKLHAAQKRLLEVGLCLTLVRLMVELVDTMDWLSLMRMKSCYRKDFMWPLYLAVSEFATCLVPLFCFARFFSYKMTLYTHN